MKKNLNQNVMAKFPYLPKQCPVKDVPLGEFFLLQGNLFIAIDVCKDLKYVICYEIGNISTRNVLSTQTVTPVSVEISIFPLDEK